ncbi:uncharacterized protein M6B38_344905 [Iris pallida]|uniref:Viral late gene transcription factor 3 zinc ribbon domain-containing protein n=1 Tax=Iris pallida TaxID=29817 RepID=A0AAX6GT46_IRIPA|nr:uncharacterized protein M6B38_344905 [Iris pallida]
MEASILGGCSITSSVTSPIPTTVTTSRPPLSSFSRNPNPNPNPKDLLLGRGRTRKRRSSGAGISTLLVAPAATIVDGGGVAASDVSGTVEITWQIVVGALAGITPFIVAGIEFGKRIVAQKKCKVCGGSGLVLEDDSYYRCPDCGGFLPWQSWKRFFTG